MKKKVLTTSWHPGGMNAIVPVIKRLNQEGKVDVVTVGHQYSEAILNNHGIGYRKINDYNLEDVTVEAMERLLKEESPDLVLTGTSAQDENNKDVIEQTVTLAAQRRLISSLAVLDFWSGYSLRFDDIYTGEKHKFLPDRIAVMDKYAMREMLEEGFDKEKLVITGNPHFDDLESKAREFTEEERRDLREQIGLSGEVLFFYAANAWKKERDKYGFWDLDNVKLVNEVLQNLSEDKIRYGLVVKLHPRVPEEDLEEIKEYIITQTEGRIKLVSNIHPQKLVLASDLTLTPFSTLGIETIYMGKPCISMQPNLKGEDSLAILTKNGIIPVGYTTENCKALVQKAFVDINYREKELIEQASNFRTDGKATERVTNLVYEMSS